MMPCRPRIPSRLLLRERAKNSVSAASILVDIFWVVTAFRRVMIVARAQAEAHRSTPKLPSLEFHPGWALSPIHLDCARTRSRISDQVRMISDLRTEACRAPRRAMPPRGRAAPRPLAHGGPGHSLAGGCLFAIFKLSAGGLACPGCLLVCHLCSALLCSALLSSVGIGEERGPGDIGIGTGMVGGD